MKSSWNTNSQVLYENADEHEKTISYAFYQNQ